MSISSIGQRNEPKSTGTDLEARDSGISKLEEVTSSIYKAITEPMFQGTFPDDLGKAREIDQLDHFVPREQQDDEWYFQKYWFPKVSHSDLLGAVEEVIYNGRSSGILNYDEPIGCYAMVSLRLSREEAEDRYEDLLMRFGCKRRDPKIRSSRDWFVWFQRFRNPVEYTERQREITRIRQAALQKTVEKCKAKNLYADVMAPDPDFLINTMHFSAEYVARCDTIILVYKRLEAELFNSSRSLCCVHSITTAQRKNQKEYDLTHKSITQTMSGELPFLDASSPLKTIKESNKIVELPTEPQVMPETTSRVPRFSLQNRSISRWISINLIKISQFLKNLWQRLFG